MFIPAPYREPPTGRTVELIRQNPLALLVTVRAESDGVLASHVPIIMDPDESEVARASSSKHADKDEHPLMLLGHMNRANPHWKAIECGEALAVFTGPNSYVSPTLYATTPAAPTWDFTAVHVRGNLEPLEQGEPTLEVVTATVRALEGQFGAEWNMESSLAYFHSILPAVGAFRFRVHQVESMFKLSQEQPAEVRERVRQAFACGGDQRAAVARLMACPSQRPN